MGNDRLSNHPVTKGLNSYWFQIDGTTATTRFERGAHALKNPKAIGKVHEGLTVLVESLNEMIREQKVVFDSHSALPGLTCGLLAIVNSDIGTGFMKNQRAPTANHTQFDFASARVTRDSDSPERDGTNQTSLHFERYRGQVFDAIVRIDLMEMRGRAGEHTFHGCLGQTKNKPQRIDSLILQFTDRIGTHTTVGAIDMSGDLIGLPVHGGIALRTLSFRRPCILRKIKIDMDRLQLAKCSACDFALGMHHRW